METPQRGRYRPHSLYVALNYSPQGDGNFAITGSGQTAWFVALNYSPQGDGNLIPNALIDKKIESHLTIPRKGMETVIFRESDDNIAEVALNYSPQGDGNFSIAISA